MRFFSDNAAAACPEVMAAIEAANRLDTAYDGDSFSARLSGAFSELFETEVEALWVATGTAANSLALAALCPPYGSIICHRDAHIQNDECGAPEFYTHGAKLVLGEGEGAKLSPETVETLIGAVRKDVHQVQPAALSITNATEYGLVYTPDEVAALGELCKRRGLGFHMDGARFANAVARLGCAPADLTWRAGLDALSPGACPSDSVPPQARRASPLQRPVHGRADPGDARGRPVAAQRPRREPERRTACGRRRRAACPARGGKRNLPQGDP
jgi:threonine aldolase